MQLFHEFTLTASLCYWKYVVLKSQIIKIISSKIKCRRIERCAIIVLLVTPCKEIYKCPDKCSLLSKNILLATLCWGFHLRQGHSISMPLL